MGEIAIPPKHNVHENSNSLNIINPYRHTQAGGGSPMPSIHTYYPFDGDANDVVRGHNPFARTPRFATGIHGQALELIATHANTMFYDPNMFDPTTDGFTLACWLKSTSNARGRIFSTGADAQNVMVEFNSVGVVGDLQLYAPGKATGTISSVNISDWFHLIFSAEKTGYSFWMIDGNVVIDKEYDADYQGYAPGNTYNVLGASRSDTLRANGLIDGMAWYDGALTVAQAQSEYQRHLTGELI